MQMADHEPIKLEDFYIFHADGEHEDFHDKSRQRWLHYPNRLQSWEAQVPEQQLRERLRRPVALSYWNPRFVQREYVVDSGASAHIVSFNALSKEGLKNIRNLPETMTTETADGETVAEEETDIYIHSLSTLVSIVILHNDTPAPLSVGNLAKDNHIYVSWSDSGPTLTLADDTMVSCEMGCNVPMILAGKHKKTKKKVSEKKKRMAPAAVSPAVDAS